MKKALVWTARAIQYLFWAFVGSSFAGMLLLFPGIIAYGFCPRWDLAAGVTALWWAGLYSIVVREKWDGDSL